MEEKQLVTFQTDSELYTRFKALAVTQGLTVSMLFRRFMCGYLANNGQMQKTLAEFAAPNQPNQKPRKAYRRRKR